MKNDPLHAMNRPRRRAARHLSRIVTVGAVAIAMAGMAQVPAYAENHPLDGKDPQSAGCAGDARTVYAEEITFGNSVIGMVDLRYSNSCHAAWARIRLSRLGSYNEGSIIRNTDNKTYICTDPKRIQIDGYWVYSCYTKMVYDRDPRTARAEGGVVYQGNGHFGYTPSY